MNTIEKILEDMKGMRNLNFVIDAKTVNELNRIKLKLGLPNQSTTIKYLVKEEIKRMKKNDRKN